MTCLCRNQGEAEEWSELTRNLGIRLEAVVSTTLRPLYPRQRCGTHCTGGLVLL